MHSPRIPRLLALVALLLGAACTDAPVTGTSFLDPAVGIDPSQDVDAGYEVKELYVELLIPVIGAASR